MHKTYKAAVVQAAPAFLDLQGGVEKTIKYIKEAAANDAKIVVFPECFIPGYPWWVWLQNPAESIVQGYVSRYYDNALVYGSPEAQQIAAAAAEAGITVVLGLTEKIGSTLYIAQWVIGAEGETIRRRRKLRVTHAERYVFGEGDGSDIAVDDIPTLGKVGALSCWEHILSLNRYAMCTMGEEVHCAAWPSFSVYTALTSSLSAEVNCALARTYAVELSCFVLSACSTVSPEMIEELCGTDEGKHKLLQAGGGHSRIFAPDGSELAENLAPTEEGILYATVDTRLIDVAHSVSDPAGHYSRPDVYRLLFNSNKQERIERGEIAGKRTLS